MCLLRSIWQISAQKGIERPQYEKLRQLIFRNRFPEFMYRDKVMFARRGVDVMHASSIRCLMHPTQHLHNDVVDDERNV